MNKNLFLAFLPVTYACLYGPLLFMPQQGKAEQEMADTQVTPPRPLPPFKSYISGVGIVEPSSESIFIESPVNRLVDKVLIHAGEKVKKGDVLLQLEARDLEADLQSRQVDYEIALAKLKKLEALPRAEDVLPAEGALKQAELELGQAKSQYERVQGLQDSRALSLEEIDRRFFNYLQAQTKWDQAKADLDKIKAGTWKFDLNIAQLEVQQAKVNKDRIKADIERTLIRAPIDSSILQIKIHEGELADTSKNPLIILGDTDEMNLRVSINQFEVSRFHPNAAAVAFSQGDVRVEFPLEFISLEPYLVNKQNLTNDILEKVDTRVLQVIYRIKKDTKGIFVGQQMDVYIDTDSSS